MSRKPAFKSVWTKETVEQVLKEHLEFGESGILSFLCTRSPTFNQIWSQHSYLLKRRAKRFSPKYAHYHLHSDMLFTGIYCQERIDLLTAFLKHELESFN